MPYSDIYLYSPLSAKTVQEGQNRGLLLQFILSEIFHTMDAHKKDDPLAFVFSSPACFFPKDWSLEVGCLNKISEHAQLLPFAFGKLASSITAFDKSLKATLQKVASQKNRGEEVSPSELEGDLGNLFILLEPFLIACKESESLLVFLLKHPEEIQRLASPENLSSLLAKMYPEGLENISHIIRREYKSHSGGLQLEKILSHYDA